MPDYRCGFATNFIAAVEFGTKEPTLKIESVQLEELADEKGVNKTRWVVRFQGAKRGWVLNLTNAQLLAALWGRDTDGWVGHAVTLGAEQVRLGKDMVPGIRVRGTPEISEPQRVEVKLPRKKPQVVTLVPTGKVGAA